MSEAEQTTAAPGGVERERWNDPKYNGQTIVLSRDATGDEYVFRWPNRGHIGRYSQEAMEGNALKAARNLLLALLLYPAKDDLAAQFEDKPGLPIALANAINKETGLTEQFTPKQ